jgi:hypothetical protein
MRGSNTHVNLPVSNIGIILQHEKSNECLTFTSYLKLLRTYIVCITNVSII